MATLAHPDRTRFVGRYPALASRAAARALRTFALSRPRRTKRAIAMLVDACLCAITCYAAVILRLGFWPERDTPFGLLVAVSVMLALPLFWALNLYREIFSQAGLRAVLGVARACAIYTLPFATVFTVFSVFGIPRTITLIQPILLFITVAASRLLARFWLWDVFAPGRADRRRVLVYGAGAAGRQLVAAIAQSADLVVVGYLDDNAALDGSTQDGLRIHSPQRIADIARRRGVDEILLAMPAASLHRRTAIVADALAVNLRVRTLPALGDIAQGRVEVTQLRNVEIEDLLGRASVTPDGVLIARAIRGRTIMVTGAGGSIGSELCRQLLAVGPARLLLIDTGEFALYEIHRNLIAASQACDVIPLLASVCDSARIDEIVSTWRPDAIYHAAALKHVPLVEHNPASAIRTNLIGTDTVAAAAVRWHVADFVLISTDKAVRPSNVMGATKRGAELVIQALAAKEFAPSSRTRFSIVRFGNVLGSSGSVVPLFREQIRSGGPITLTDRRVTRYFMTMTEAAELVLQAGAMANGGEVFVLDMGPPIRVADLARNMVELAGLNVRDEANPDGDIAIVEVGLRPGEKLAEELLIGRAPEPTGHPRIQRAREPMLTYSDLRRHINRITALLDQPFTPDLLIALRALVPEFTNDAGVLDWVHLSGDTLDDQGANQAKVRLA